MSELCQCCEDHADEAIEHEPIECIVCGEQCQCEGCIADFYEWDGIENGTTKGEVVTEGHEPSYESSDTA